MSIRYIQFRTDIVIPAGNASRSFNAWTHEKHADFIEPERTQFGLTLHEIRTETQYVKGAAIKDVKRTGKRWDVPISSVAWFMIEDDKQKSKA